VSGTEPERQGLLQDHTVFLSASVPVRPGFPRVSDAAVEIEEAVISFGRAVLREAGTVVFGAHPSISPLVASVASEYLSPRVKTVAPPEVESIGTPKRFGPGVVIYQSHAYDGYVPDKTWDMYHLGYADLIWCGAKNGEQFDPKNRKLQCPQSLRFMRQQMFGKESPSVMVAMGGMDGVFEEAELFMKDRRRRGISEKTSPIYLMESTGGAAGLMAGEALDSGSPQAPHLVEREWERKVSVTVAESGERSDPRARPFVPYPLIMQWLVKEIAKQHAAKLG
jgi:hypothetical protein